MTHCTKNLSRVGVHVSVVRHKIKSVKNLILNSGHTNTNINASRHLVIIENLISIDVGEESNILHDIFYSGNVVFNHVEPQIMVTLVVKVAWIRVRVTIRTREIVVRVTKDNVKSEITNENNEIKTPDGYHQKWIRVELCRILLPGRFDARYTFG